MIEITWQLARVIVAHLKSHGYIVVALSLIKSTIKKSIRFQDNTLLHDRILTHI